MSISRKRTSLEALLRPVEPPTPAPAPAVAITTPAVARRRTVRQQTVYLPVAVHEHLRRLAFEERVKMHALLMEGLDRVFRDRGLPGLDELGGAEDDRPG
jgi:hypothetical protein